jgi:hypothetical protein
LVVAAVLQVTLDLLRLLVDRAVAAAAVEVLLLEMQVLRVQVVKDMLVVMVLVQDKTIRPVAAVVLGLSVKHFQITYKLVPVEQALHQTLPALLLHELAVAVAVSILFLVELLLEPVVVVVEELVAKTHLVLLELRTQVAVAVAQVVIVLQDPEMADQVL